ncbi:hypothetical protein EC957_003152 [Mortierella hygrophila]|uniref:Cation chloride cotransporter n=1 Tax=Mortierella hygrophila TaxID=979708 RepID=A0A9P6K774_9FUNG|nr:hypothetical protein EC957_003152 [Mortierella hygrophila]
MSQQPQNNHGTSSSIDITPSAATAASAAAPKPPLRPRLDRPYSSPSTITARHNNNNSNTYAHRSSISSQPPLSSASSVTSSTATSNSGRTARPANAVLPGISRPKTVYQAVTWKENLDAFNRRLRRGSLSLDAAAQEEELASQALAQARAQQLQQQRQQADQDSQDNNSTTGLDEQAHLLAKNNNTQSKFLNGQGGVGTYGATAIPDARNSQQSLGKLQDRAEPAFPTLLNPALATTKSSKLGVFSGVFVPCILSIWGIILFLRFGFIIAQAGVMGTMAMFIVGYAINIFTTLSLSAISTNGTVRGGGVYYLLSRSLGPEFGGSIGLIYFLGTVIGCGMNVLGFVEPLISNFGESTGTVYRVLPEGPVWGFIYGTILLVSCTLICLVGSKLFSRASLVLAVIILLSTLSIFVSFAVMPPFTHLERNIDYTGFSWETLQENMWPKFTATNGPDGPKESFETVFGVLFPACIGILAGASMSGDLEDPSKSIPKGTLWAVGSSFCVYTCIVILMGGSISRSTMYTDLSVLQDVSVSPLFIASGSLAASVFATLGSVIGAAKILQAIARDNLLPLLSVFGQGTPRTDEPTLAVLLTYILCQFCLFLTDMNAIATFVSMITLLTFLILNLACFLLKIGSAPNFRPSFRFFHWWTAFGGMVLCALVMGSVDLGKSLLSGLMTAVLFIWIHYWSPPKRWGDVTQSLIYHQVRKYLLRLDSRKEHVKFWRPQILLLVHHPRSEYHLIQFCNHLKKGALYVLGHVILGDFRDVLAEYRRQQGSWLKFVDVLQIKAFVNLSVADSVRIGARNLLIGTGLGGMRPNIVVMGSFNLERYQRDKQEQELRQLQQQSHQLLSPRLPQSPLILQKGVPILSAMNNSNTDHTLLNIPVSLPIDNIRVEAPIKITDYVSIIEDVLSLNKAVAIGYGFERLDLPEEHKSMWKMFSFGSSGLSSPFFSPSSRPSSVYKHGESRKKKYIDLWPMQMSIAPLECYDAGHQATPSFPGNKRFSRDLSASSPMTPGAGATFTDPTGSGAAGPSRMAEANLTNFDTYTMVLQMGCILHMVPHWKENFTLRVMVFVEYKEDVEEEKKRLKALLENLRIPAEVKVMCLDGGDSETYDRLIKGEGLDEYPIEDMAMEYNSEEGSDSEEPESPAAPVAQRVAPRNINPLWQQEAALHEEDEDEEGVASQEEMPQIHEDGRDSSHETGPYSNVAGQRDPIRVKDPTFAQRNFGPRSQNVPVFQASAPLAQVPQRRRTISHPDRPPFRQQSPHALRVQTGASPRIRQGSPLAMTPAHPGSQHFASSSSGSGGGLRRRSTMGVSPASPMETRLGTSVPLGTSMSFRIGLPPPRQYFDPNESNSESESDSISSEDDEDYDHNDDDLVYGGGWHQQQQQQQQQQALLSPRLQHLSPHGRRQFPSAHPTQHIQQQQNTNTNNLYKSLASPPQHHTQQSPLLPTSSAFAHTSLGSEPGLGIAFGGHSTDNEQHVLGQSYNNNNNQQYATSPSQDPQLFDSQKRFQEPSPTMGDTAEAAVNPWASTSSSLVDRQQYLSSTPVVLGHSGSSNSNAWNSSGLPPPIPPNEASHRAAPSAATATAVGDQHSSSSYSNSSTTSISPILPAVPMFAEELLPIDTTTTHQELSPPLQFDHLNPEAQLMILNELMRIHSSAETTSIVFTTVPAPEEGTCLREESSLAYLEQLDLLMEGIDIPVLLIHAKSLTVTMTL